MESREWFEAKTQNDLNIEQNSGYPKVRRCHDCVLVGKCVFVMGGTDGSNVFGDIWKLDLQSLQWTKVWVDLPRTLYFHSAAISSTGRLSVFGGVTHTNHKDRTNELFTAWLTIPSLKEIAFEAFLFYLRTNKSQCTSDVLFQLGLPSNLIERFK